MHLGDAEDLRANVMPERDSASGLFYVVDRREYIDEASTMFAVRGAITLYIERRS